MLWIKAEESDNKSSLGSFGAIYALQKIQVSWECMQDVCGRHTHHTFTGALVSIAKFVKVCQIYTILIRFVTVGNTWGKHLTWNNDAS